MTQLIYEVLSHPTYEWVHSVDKQPCSVSCKAFRGQSLKRGLSRVTYPCHAEAPRQTNSTAEDFCCLQSKVLNGSNRRLSMRMMKRLSR